MRQIWIVAHNTYREVIRDRILYGLFLFAILIIGMSLVLGQLSFTEQARISANIGLMAIHLGAAALAIFIGSTLVVKEIDKQTILTVLVRPLSRTQFIAGKFFGLALVIGTVMLGLTVCLLLVFGWIGIYPSVELGVTLIGIFLESLCLLGYALVFSVFARPVLVVCFSVGVFLIGHWFSSLRYFARQPGTFVDWTHKVLRFSFPDFETLNWKNLVIYDDPLQGTHYYVASIYALLWVAFLVTLTAAMFERKDLV